MADLNKLPRAEFGGVTVPGDIINAGTVPGTALSSNTRTKIATQGPLTVATTGAAEYLVIAPCTGTVTNAKFTSKDTLATDNTNYVTFAIQNKGQAGAGTTAILAASDANTTKTTGGTAVTAYVPRNLTLHGTAGNLAVNSGDLLLVTVTAAATSANTMTFTSVAIAVSPTS